MFNAWKVKVAGRTFKLQKAVEEKKVEEANDKTEGSKRKAEEEKVEKASPENNSLFIL